MLISAMPPTYRHLFISKENEPHIPHIRAWITDAWADGARRVIVHVLALADYFFSPASQVTIASVRIS